MAEKHCNLIKNGGGRVNIDTLTMQQLISMVASGKVTPTRLGSDIVHNGTGDTAISITEDCQYLFRCDTSAFLLYKDSSNNYVSISGNYGTGRIDTAGILKKGTTVYIHGDNSSSYGMLRLWQIVFN